MRYAICDTRYAITAFQVFEHLPDPAGNLARLHRILKPGGVILIEVPNIDTWSVRLLGPRHRHFVQDHLTFFSVRTLGLLLEKHDFMEALAKGLGLWERVVSINLGDIIAVIARKMP